MPLEDQSAEAIQTPDGQFIDAGMTNHLVDLSKSLSTGAAGLLAAVRDGDVTRQIADSPMGLPARSAINGSQIAPAIEGRLSDALLSVHPSDARLASEDDPVAVPAISPEGAFDTAAENDILKQERLRDLETYLRQPGIEGFFATVTPDTRGFPTAAYGHKVLPTDHLKLGETVSRDIGERFLREDSLVALANADQQARAAKITEPNFINHLAAVNFQMGPGWTDKFPNTWALIKAGKYGAAATEAGLSSNHKAPSDWATQTPRRLEEFQRALRSLAPKP